MVAALLPIACSTGEPPDEQTTTTGGPTGSPTSFPTTTDPPPTSTDTPTTSVGTTSDPSTASAGTSSSGTTGAETTGDPPGDLLCPTLFRFDPPPGGSAPRVAGEWQGFDLATAPVMTGPNAGVYTVTIAQQPAPVVSSASISGKVGTPLSFSASVTSANPVTYSLTGAPAGMSIGTTGTVSWASPVAGSYKVTVVAKDTKTGLTGQGVYTVAIAAPLPPVVTAASISGKPGVALSFSVAVSAPNPVTYTLVGAPAGMSIGATGVIGWSAPVLGSYSVTVVAKDTKTGLTGQGVMTIKIATAGPTITAAAMTGVAGKPMSGTIAIADPGATSLSISISGVPLGMGFSMSGLTLTANWAAPVTGSYTLQVSVVDQAGLTAKASIPVTITAK